MVRSASQRTTSPSAAPFHSVVRNPSCPWPSRPASPTISPAASEKSIVGVSAAKGLAYALDVPLNNYLDAPFFEHAAKDVQQVAHRKGRLNRRPVLSFEQVRYDGEIGSLAAAVFQLFHK